MAVAKEQINTEISWFNEQLSSLNEMFVAWLKEEGHKIDYSEIDITKKEELSGEYSTKQYNINIDDSLKISLVPYGIWIVAAKGRVDLVGPSGNEKLVYLLKSGPTTTIEISNGSYHSKSVHRDFNNIDEDGWYWYDDSLDRRMVKFDKNIVVYLLGRLQ
jgi:hypothetical protein